MAISDAGRLADKLKYKQGRGEILSRNLNYREDGTPFRNALYVSSPFNEANDLIYFFASQRDVTEHKTSQLQAESEQPVDVPAAKHVPDDLVAAIGVISKPYTASGLLSVRRYLEEGVRRPPLKVRLPVGLVLSTG